MTAPKPVYLVTLDPQPGTPAALHVEEAMNDVLDLAYIACEDVQVFKNPGLVPGADAIVSLSVICNPAFAAEMANTKGIAAVIKTDTPNCIPARHP